MGLLFIVLVSFFWSVPRVADVTLDELASGADVIVVGRVVRVVRLDEAGTLHRDEDPPVLRPSLRLAEVRIEDVWRGQPKGTSVWVLAQPNGACDLTTAVLGERAVWFLESPSEPPSFREEEGDALSDEGFFFAFGRPAPVPDAAREAIQRLAGGVLHSVRWFGRGRMVVEPGHAMAESNTVRDRDSWVAAPLSVVPPDEPGCHRSGDQASGIAWRARLSNLERWVRTRVEDGFFPMPLHPETGAPAKLALYGRDGFVAVLWGDDTVARAREEHGGPHFALGPAQEGLGYAEVLYALEDLDLCRRTHVEAASRKEARSPGLAVFQNDRVHALPSAALTGDFAFLQEMARALQPFGTVRGEARRLRWVREPLELERLP